MSGNTLSFEVALVHAHPEVTIKTPASSPRVGNNPVWSRSLLTPTNNFDSVTTELSTSGMNINTRFIIHEIRVDGESSLDWTVGIDFLLDRGFISESAVALSMIFCPSTRTSTWGFASTRISTSRGVWITSIRDDTWVFKIIPAFVKVTTIAAVVTSITRDHILWGKYNVLTTFNTGSIRENFRGGESPTGTTSGLISDGVHAAWPLVDRVEWVWESDEISKNFCFLTWHWWEWFDDGTEKESLDFSFSHSRELIGASNPWVLHRVDEVDLFLGTDVSTVRDRDKREAK